MTGTDPYITAGTSYNAAGQPSGIAYNGVTTSLGYDSETLRLTSISAPGAGVDLGYQHSPDGNITRITENSVSTDFGYDDLHRLSSATGAFDASYNIDKIGRMSSKVEGGSSHSMQFNDTNHKHAPTSIDTSGLSYDENGNLTAFSARSYQYNTENQLVKVSQGSAYVARFAVDGDGQRRKRVDNNGTVIYAGPHYERNVGTGADTSDVITKLYWAQFGPMRRLIAVRKGGVLSYLHHDHLGSTKAISGTTGGPMKYYPFGSTYQEIASPPTDNLYNGQKRDLSTGLYYYGARYYSATSGTFTQPDSIVPQPGNPQSLNRYSYTLNNPLKYTDPTGHAASDLQYKEPGWFDQAWRDEFEQNNKRKPEQVDWVFRFVTMGLNQNSGYSGEDIMRAVTIAIGAGLSESGPGLWSQPVDQTGIDERRAEWHRKHAMSGTAEYYEMPPEDVDVMRYGAGYTEYRWGKVRIVMAAGGRDGSLVRTLGGGQDNASTISSDLIVFTRPLDLSASTDMQWLMHELRHVMQAQFFGWGYMPPYLTWILGGHARNPFEKDANAFANASGTGAPPRWD